jgi:hypothetical protein
VKAKLARFDGEENERHDEGIFDCALAAGSI